MVTCIARRDMNIVYHTLQHKSTYLRDTTLATHSSGRLKTDNALDRDKKEGSMKRNLILMTSLLAVISACATGLQGTNLSPQLIPVVQRTLHEKFYPNCTDIKPIEVLDIQPPEMKGKKISIGDSWTETWRISACGVTKVHRVELKRIEGPRKGLIATVIGVLEAE